jgi:hypothetical protein
MTQQHPITPPPELVQQWVDTYFGEKISQSNFHLDLATRAAQWGADQELEACCKMLYDRYDRVRHATGFPGSDMSDWLRAARRPKPPSLKEQALLAIDTAVADYRIAADVADVVCRALEQLPDNN